MGHCSKCFQHSDKCCCSFKSQKSEQDQCQVQIPVQVQDSEATPVQEGQVVIQDGPEATQNAFQGPQNQLQRHGNQRNGDQTNEGHTNISPLQNNQSISTPIDVSGVNVNVKCGDFMPFPYPFPFPVHKCNCCPDSPFCTKSFDHKDCRKDKRKSKECDCCTEALSEFLCFVRDTQRSLDVEEGVDIYLASATGLGNPIDDQIITDVESCFLIRFRDEGETGPITAAQLCKVAGLSVTEDEEDPPGELFTLIQDYINNLNAGCSQDKGKCDCSCCASAIGEELDAARRFPQQLTAELFINGVDAELADLTVLLVKDCLVYLTNTTEDTIYVFSLCAITAVTVS
ncbi:hypothetical protein [Sutcliffiella horikoshii]|uniref:hypothetical protein n=1 Tax=Sutcliffiella horikoshii TaxID=79883 RepID=UPI001CFCBEB2|nr:hypothetical protein [Sutcliffiella horikoshii]